MPMLATERQRREEFLALLEEKRRRIEVKKREAGRWAPRPYQRPLWDYLSGGGLRADVAAHRRWGKDDVALAWAFAASQRRIGTYWHMLPEQSQGRKAIWDAVNPHTGQRRIDEAFPQHLVPQRRRDNEMIIHFENGSTWQVVGSDNYNSLVGASLAGVVLSEWSLAKPEAWSYLRPILAESGGWAIFIWTPRGRNHAVRAFEARERDPSWFTLRSPASKTGVFSPEQLDRELREYIDELGSEDEGQAKYDQEYEVDFNAAVPGSYFGKHMTRAHNEGRIGNFGHVPRLPVDTSWDLGVDDYTAVWFWQDNGRRVRCIGYFEFSGEGAEAIVRQCMPEMIPDPAERAARLAQLGRSTPYTYRNHYLPHDVMNREWGAGAKSRFETLTALGLRGINVGVARNPADRINASRRLLPLVFFDNKGTEVGRDRLTNYRRRFNKTLRTYGEPLHDQNSHGADSFGEYAVNSRIAPVSASRPKAPPADRWAEEEHEERNAWKVI